MIFALIAVAISSLLIAAISQVVLWKFDGIAAYVKQRRTLESWETQSIQLLRLGAAKDSYKNFGTPLLPIVSIEIPKVYSGVTSLRVPILRKSVKNKLLFQWRKFSSQAERCLEQVERNCKSLSVSSGLAFINGDLEMDFLKVQAGLNILAATGKITIKSLVIPEGALVEIVSGSNLTIGSLAIEPGSSLLLESVLSSISLPSISSQRVNDCKNTARIEISSSFPTQFTDGSKSSAGCSSGPRSQYWHQLRFLGDASQKSLTALKL